MEGMTNDTLLERVALAFSNGDPPTFSDTRDAVLAVDALGLEDLDAAVTRGARVLHPAAFGEEWAAPGQAEAIIQARQRAKAVLTAALTPPGEQSG